MRVLLFLVAWAALCAGAPAPPPPPLWYFAPVLSGGGYSTEAIALLHGLVNVLPADEKPSAVRVSHHGDAISTEHYLGLPDHYREALDAAMRPRPPLPARDFVVVCHSEPGAWDPPRYHTTRCPPEGYGRAGALAVIGRTMFETDRLEDEHVRRCNRMREVWVPTSWSARVFEAAGVRKEKIRVVPEAVDVDAFDPAAFSTATGGGDRAPYDATGNGVLAVGPRLDDDAASGVTKFLSVFKWEARKAPEVLLDAYFREFSASDAVALFLRCELFHEDGRDLVRERVVAAAKDAFHATPKSEGKRLWGTPDGEGVDAAIRSRAPRVFILPRASDEEMPSLYAAADAFVLPSRGEGWGRPHVEAMAMALPVIATNWSGPTEFMTEANSYPVRIEDALVALPEESAFRTHKWAQPSATALRAAMRAVASNPQEAKAKGENARRTMVERFSPRVVAELVTEELRRVAAKARRRTRAGDEDEL